MERRLYYLFGPVAIFRSDSRCYNLWRWHVLTLDTVAHSRWPPPCSRGRGPAAWVPPAEPSPPSLGTVTHLPSIYLALHSRMWCPILPKQRDLPNWGSVSQVHAVWGGGLHHALREYPAYYHHERNQQGKGNVLLFSAL